MGFGFFELFVRVIYGLFCVIYEGVAWVWKKVVDTTRSGH